VSSKIVFSKEQIKVITKILSVFSDGVNVYKNWGFYLFDKHFDKEQELRNRIGIIIIASLFDVLDIESKIPSYQVELQELNLIHLNRYCLQVIEYIETIKEFLSEYSKEEQILIINLRNQYVHSFLSGRHSKTTMKIKYVENGKFREENILIDDYHLIIESFLAHNNLDDLQKHFLDIWLNIGRKYSSITTEFIQNIELISDSMYNGREMMFKHINI